MFCIFFQINANMNDLNTSDLHSMYCKTLLADTLLHVQKQTQQCEDPTTSNYKRASQNRKAVATPASRSRNVRCITVCKILADTTNGLDSTTTSVTCHATQPADATEQIGMKYLFL